MAKANHRTRNKGLTVRLTNAEHERIVARAKEQGVSMRDLVLGVGGESTRVDAPSPYRLVPVAALRPSGSSSQDARRQRFDAEGLAGLAESIRGLGVVEPLVVRKVDGDAQAWEIVAGERRWRAAQLAGLDEVPVLVGDWDDEQSQVLQLVENLQREGLHVLDEVRGYGVLVDAHGWDVARLVQETGRSRSYVYQRMRLRTLGDECLRALEEGRIGATVARLLATVPRRLQRRALQSLPQTATTREAEALVHRRFRRVLGEAGFGVDDESLLARWTDDDGTKFKGKRGCGTCPWNTTVEPGLGGQPAICVQPECYAGKQSQAAARHVAAAKRRGQRVVQASADDFYHGDATVPRSDRYVLAENRRVREFAVERGVEPTLLRLPREKAQADGAYPAIEVYPIAELRKEGYFEERDEFLEKHRKEAAAQRKKKKKRAQLIAAAATTIGDAIPVGECLADGPRAIIRLLVEHLRRRAGSANVRRLAREAWGDDLQEADHDGRWVASLDDAELLRLGVQLCAVLDVDMAEWSEKAYELLSATAAAAADPGYTWNT